MNEQMHADMQRHRNDVAIRNLQDATRQVAQAEAAAEVCETPTNSVKK